MKTAPTVALLAAIAVCACAPVLSHDFYKPRLLEEVSGSYTTKGYCYSAYGKPLRGHGSAGPPSRIVVPISKILFSVSITGETKDELNFRIDLSVPMGVHLKLTGSKVTLLDADMKVKSSFDLVLHYRRSGVVVSDDGTVELTGKTFVYWTGLFGVANFELFAPVPKPVPDELVVVFPKILENGVVVELPRMRFKREHSTELFSALNC